MKRFLTDSEARQVLGLESNEERELEIEGLLARLVRDPRLMSEAEKSGLLTELRRLKDDIEGRDNQDLIRIKEI